MFSGLFKILMSTPPSPGIIFMLIMKASSLITFSMSGKQQLTYLATSLKKLQ